jgi:cytochrome oxidase Cu insertion factor (SCO1/SenC/PrrC family)
MRRFALGCVVALGLVGNPYDTIVPLLKSGDRLPAARFVDQDGRSLVFSNLKGDAVAVAFVYTRCKDACPVITEKFGQAGSSLGDGPFRLIEITVDPAYDRPPVISAYAQQHAFRAPLQLFLTGSPHSVADFERRLGVQSLDAGGGEILHNNRVVLVAPDGTIADFIDGSSWTAPDLAAELRHIAGENSSWLDRFDLALGRAAAYCGSVIAGRSGIGDLVASVGVFVVGIVIFVWLTRRLFAAR